MWRFSFRSKNLDYLADQLSSMGWGVEKEVARGISYRGKVKSKKYLNVKGESICCYLYPTDASVHLLFGKEAISERDKKLVGFIMREYKLPLPRSAICLPPILGGLFYLSFLIGYLSV